MSFTQEPTVRAVGIRDISVELFFADPADGGHKSAHADIQIAMSNGAVHVRRYDLQDHLSSNVLQQLSTLLDWIRNEAVTKILPPE